MKKLSDTKYPYDTRIQEAKIMRALVAAGDAGLPGWRIMRLTGPGWQTERALKRLRMFEKARCEIVKVGQCGKRQTWFALVADDTMERGLNPDWTIEIVGA